MKIVATTSLPAVDRPNADHSNAARSLAPKNAHMKEETREVNQIGEQFLYTNRKSFVNQFCHSLLQINIITSEPN